MSGFAQSSTKAETANERISGTLFPKHCPKPTKVNMQAALATEGQSPDSRD